MNQKPIVKAPHILICFVVLIVYISYVVPVTANTNQAVGVTEVEKEKSRISLTTEEKKWIKAHPDIQLGAPTSYPPLVIKNAKGPHTGMLVDLFELISQRLNTNIRLHIEDSWPSVLEKAKNRNIDGLASGGRSTSREEYLNPTDTLYSTYHYIFARTNDQLHLKSVKELEGMRIGYKRADTPVKSLIDKYTAVTPVPYNDNVAMTKGLMNKEVDVLVAWISYDFWRRDKLQGAVDNILLATDNPMDMYIHIRKDWPELIPILNKVLSSIRQNELPTIMDKWFIQRPRLPEIPKIHLTVKEQTWLAKNQTIRVRVTNFPPYIIPKKDGVPEGIAIDYLRLIAERTGIRLKYHSSGKLFSEALAGLKKHQGPDLILTIMPTPDRQQFINFSKEYFKSPYMIFTRQSDKQIIVSIDDLIEKKIALVKGTVLSEMIKRDYPDISLLTYANDIKAIEAVAGDNADAYIGNLTLASYHILKKGLYNLKISGPSPFGDHVFSMGIRNDWPELTGIIDKGLATITPQEQTEIRNRYISLKYEKGDNAAIIKWVLIVFALASLVILLFVSLNRSLKKQVAIRTNELESSEEQYRYLFENMVQGAFYQSAGGELLDVNSAALEIFGLSYDQFIGKTSKDPQWRVVHEDGTDFPGEEHPSMVSLKTGKECREVVAGIYDIMKKDYTWVTINAVPQFKKGEERPYQVFVTMHDITERKKAEEKLQRNESLLNMTQELAKIGGWEVDLEKQITYWTDAVYRIHDLDKEEFSTIDEAVRISLNCYDPEDRQLIMETYKKCIEEGKSYDLELPFTTTKGRRLWVRATANSIMEGDRVVKIVGNLIDITERKKTEAERMKLESKLSQSQKMESIGTLAGGIAHDFNNILFPIVGHAEMLLDDIPEDSFLRESLKEIFTGAMRARDLVKQILTFSRQESQELKILKIQPIISEAIKLIRSTIPTTVKISQDIRDDCGVIKADPTQIHQIVMNLATNANHAMNDRVGELTVTLKEITLGEEDMNGLDIEPGAYACLTVADTGVGMDKSVLDKAFDPFYTTKEQGKGTGMGLSVIHGIVKNAGGDINVYSEVGTGTQFKVYLPIMKSSFVHPELQAKEIIQGGTEQILLVDDEKSILRMEKQMLERLGYEVVSCDCSLDALELFRATPDKFDVVITDMAMPNIPGDKLTAELIKLRPGIPILLCTGFSERISEQNALSVGIKGILMKPIVKADLASKIREVIDN